MKEHLDLLDHPRFGLDDVVQHEDVCRFLHGIQDVIERRCQGVDVLAVHGRDEGRVQTPDHVVGDLVPVVLPLLDPPRLQLDVPVVIHQVTKQSHGFADVHRALREQLEERVRAL